MIDKSAGLEVVASESGRFEYRAWHPHGPNVIDQTTGRWMSASLVSEMASVLPGYVPDAEAIIAGKDAEIERLRSCYHLTDRGRVERAEAEVERLTKERDYEISRNNPLRALAKSQEERIAYLAANCRALDEARKTLESERSANEALTLENAQQTELLEKQQRDALALTQQNQKQAEQLADQSAALAKARDALDTVASVMNDEGGARDLSEIDDALEKWLAMTGGAQ